MPNKNAADDKLNVDFLLLVENKQTIHMESQVLFALLKLEQNLKMSSTTN